MSRTEYAGRQAVITAVSSMALGLLTGNPNWLLMNVPLGLVAGALVGWAMFPLHLRVLDWLDRRGGGAR